MVKRSFPPPFGSPSVTCVPIANRSKVGVTLSFGKGEGKEKERLHRMQDCVFADFFSFKISMLGISTIVQKYPNLALLFMVVNLCC